MSWETKMFSIFLLIICFGAIAGKTTTSGLDADNLAEFFREYVLKSGRSKLVIYFDSYPGGWWSSRLLNRVSLIMKIMSKYFIGSKMIDLSVHNRTKFEELAVPPGGSATICVVMYDGQPTVVNFLKKASDLRLFRSRYNWLVVTPEENKVDLKVTLQQLAVYTDSNMRFGVMLDSRIIRIWEVYHVSLRHPLRITYFGRWSPWIPFPSRHLEDYELKQQQVNSHREWHLYLAPSLYKYVKRTNLEGINLKAITVGMRQYLTDFHRKENGVLEVTGGLFGEVFRTFEETINFTYTLKYMPGYAYGKIKELGNNWTGVVGYLASKRADIAICGISQSKWRSSVIDLTTPLIFMSSTLFVYGLPSPYQYDLYLRPFTGGLWVLLAVWFFLFTLLQQILKFAFGVLEVETKGQCKKLSLKYKKSKSDNGIISSIRQVLDKGSLVGEAGTSTRLLILSGSVLFTVASTGYAAKLTSIQAIQRFTPAIETIADLSKAPDWNMGVLNGSWDRWLMQNAPPNTSMGILWEKIKMNPSSLFRYPQEGLLEVSKNQKFAYLGDTLECRLMLSGRKVGVIEAVLEEEEKNTFKHDEELLPPKVACKIAELSEVVVRLGTSFGLQKYSPIKDLFNYHLMKLWSAGIITVLRKRYIDPARKLCDTQTVFKPASLGDTLFSIILFAIGVLIALIIFAFELTLASSQRKKKIGRMRHRPFLSKYIE